MIRRIDHLRARQTWEGGGKNGFSTALSASIKLLGKASWARAYSARVVSAHIVDFLDSLLNLGNSDKGWHKANPLVALS